MIRQVFVGIISIAGFAAAVMIGMQWEQRLTVASVADAEARGYRSGFADAEASLASDERQAEFFARLLGLVNDPDVSDAIPGDARTQLNTALEAAGQGEYEVASEALPTTIALPRPNACVPTDQIVRLPTGDFFDHCESGAEISFVGFRFGSGTDIVIAIEGERATHSVGERLPLSDDCYLTYLRADVEDGERIPVLRLGCDDS